MGQSRCHWDKRASAKLGGLLCFLETNLASRWEGFRLPRASGKSPDFPGSSPDFPGSFWATFPEVLSLWNLTAIQGFPGSFPDFPGSSPNFPGGFPHFPGGQPLFLGSLTPSLDSQKLALSFFSAKLSFLVNFFLLVRISGFLNVPGKEAQKSSPLISKEKEVLRPESARISAFLMRSDLRWTESVTSMQENEAHQARITALNDCIAAQV